MKNERPSLPIGPNRAFLLEAVLSYRAVSCCIISYRTMSYRAIPCRVVPHHIIAYRIVSYPIFPYPFVWCHIVSFCIVLCCSYHVVADPTLPNRIVSYRSGPCRTYIREYTRLILLPLESALPRFSPLPAALPLLPSSLRFRCTPCPDLTKHSLVTRRV